MKPTEVKSVWLFKALSLFSLIRGYNIIIITLAQYLAAIFIMAPDLPAQAILFDLGFFMLVTASSLAIAAGYIINNFYDADKDLINRPNKYLLDHLISLRYRLSFCFILNLASVFFASYVSFRAVVFFSVYIFGIWLYSHRIKKIPLLGNIISALLSIAPFFAVFIYFKNWQTLVFVYAIFLFLLITIRELVKDLENLPGDLVSGYKTFPIIYGDWASKVLITLLCMCTLFPLGLLIFHYELGYMNYYFYFSIFMLLIFIGLLWRTKRMSSYLWLHNLLKLIIVVGVFCIILLEPEVFLNRLH